MNSPEGNSSYLQLNKSTNNDNTELQTELKLPTNDKDVTRKSATLSKILSIIKDETINTNVTDTPKLPSLNNQSKSNIESTFNDDNQVHPNIKLKTDPKTDKMIQDMDNPDKSKISNSKSPEGNSSYLQFNESIDDGLSIIKDESINAKLSDLSKLTSKKSNTYLIKSSNLKQHTNPTSSLEQNTISASGPMQNESKIGRAHV